MRSKLFSVISLAIFLSNIQLFGFWPFEDSQKQEVPEYVLNVPKTDDNFYYAVGVSTTYQNAKALALNDIASQIESEIRSISTLSKDGTDKNFVQNITIITKNKIDDYEILKDEYANETFYILIRVKK